MQLCNGGLRLMLRGDVMRIPQYQDELSSYGQHFSSRGNIAGATFIYVLYKQVPAPLFLMVLHGCHSKDSLHTVRTLVLVLGQPAEIGHLRKC